MPAAELINQIETALKQGALSPADLSQLTGLYPEVLKQTADQGDYKILKRLDIDKHPGLTPSGTDLGPLRKGCCLDTETTGFDFDNDKVIEVGLILFEYNSAYQVTRILDRYNGLEDPGAPLQQEIIDVTGLTDADLAGQSFDDSRVEEILSQADILIAHNAGFDRPMMEKRFPSTIKKCWACSLHQVAWDKEYIKARVLEFLLSKCGGWFIDAHRALNDAEGLLALLMEKLPKTGGNILQALIEKARTNDTRIYAVGSAFDQKDVLKDRGYRWNDGKDGKPKAWWFDAPGDGSEELLWLAETIYPGRSMDQVVAMPINAYIRFSRR